MMTITRKSSDKRYTDSGLPSLIVYSYTGRTRELIEAYNAAVSILYPKYAWYIYPGYLQYAIYQRYMKYFKDKYRLVPIPNSLYEYLIKNELIKSEHIIFASEDIYEQHADSKEVNFVNLTVSYRKQTNGPQRITNDEEKKDTDTLLQQMLNQATHSLLAQIRPFKNCQINCVFVQENFFSNLMDRFNLNNASVNKIKLWAKLEHLNKEQTIPNIAIKAHLYLLNNPYELPPNITELILANYFSTPRILHRGHTYRIEINTDLIGTSQYAHYYLTFVYMKFLHFRCVHLEIKGSEFELQAVVAKGFTDLVQIANTHNYLPRQFLDDMAIVEGYPAGLQTAYECLRSSIDAFLPKKTTCLSSKHIYPIFILQAGRGAGKTKLINAVARDLGLHLFGVDCTEIISQIQSHTEMKLKSVFAKSQITEPLLIAFHNFEIFGIDNEGNEDLRLLATFQVQTQELFLHNRKHPVVIVAMTSEKCIKPMIQRLFLEVIRIETPTKDERYKILEWLHKKELFKNKIFNSRDLEHLPFYELEMQQKYLNKLQANWQSTKKVLREVADKSQGFIFGDLQLLHKSAIMQQKQEKNKKLNFEHFAYYLDIMQSSFADSLGAPKVPKVLWSDIGGLAKLKDEIQSSIGLPLKHIHLIGKNLKRSGILLHGPPGTGKTLVAKAVATECNLNFLSVQGPELLNMYVGQSEQNVREVFARACSAAPCVLFLDELDSLAPNRGVAGDSGGVMDRVVSQLLAEMDGAYGNASKPIFILAATNRPDLIDPALLRPGRFDKLFYVGPCYTADDKTSVLMAQTKRFKLANNCDLQEIAKKLNGEMSGADLYSICSNAWLSAVRRTIDRYLKGDLRDEDLISEKVVVEVDDFNNSFEKCTPSISKLDLEYFKKLKSSYSM